MTTTINRRAFLRIGHSHRTGRFEKPQPPTPFTSLSSGLSPYSGSWETEQVTHLLRRTMFGARNTDVYYFSTRSPAEAIDALLTEPPLPDPPVNDYASEVFDPLVAPGLPWPDAPYNFDFEPVRTTSLKSWWIGNMLNQDRSLQEKMVLFWHNHIPIEFEEIRHAGYSYRYLRTLYEYAFGNFKSLVKALTLDPGMLMYLNGNSNNAGAPDENFARELQELYCIGKGPDAQFTEEDVQAAARVLTGWKTQFPDPESYFSASHHDTDDKQFSAFYGNRIIAGKSGPDGANELDELLDMIFDHPETARFICRKLYTFFVYQDIHETVEQQIIEPLAQLLRDQDYEIKPVLETLLKSEHFFDPWFRGSMLKSPLDQIIGLCREMHIQFPDPSQYEDLYQLRQHLHSYLPGMLQDPGDPPDVSGWPAWFQIPVYYKWWITVSTLPKRAEHTDNLLASGYTSGNFNVRLDVIAYTKSLTSPEEPQSLLEEVIRLFYGIEVADEVKTQLKSILLSGQANDYYWTNAWYDHLNAPGDPTAYSIVESRLQAFYQAILQLEEYQLL